MKYSKVDVTEQQLEDVIRIYPGQIEDGLTYIDHQKRTGTGRMDVLLADSGGALIVAELKVVEEDGMLFQGIDYYDHVVDQVERYARLYQQHKIDPAQNVRLFLIAPSFSLDLLTRCKWIDIPISLFVYNCISIDGAKEIIPVFNEVAIPSQPAAAEAYSVESRVNYVTDQTVKERVHALIEEVKLWGPGHVSVDAIQYGISLKVNGRVFAYLGMRRKHFIITTYNAEEKWTDYPVHNKEDLIAASAAMKACIERKTKS